jgi:hypothetical protein
MVKDGQPVLPDTGQQPGELMLFVTIGVACQITLCVMNMDSLYFLTLDNNQGTIWGLLASLVEQRCLSQPAVQPSPAAT